jgi:bifunctional non-homologous end joining protein LigD
VQRRGADPSGIKGAVEGPAPTLTKIAPQLATLTKAAPSGDDWLHEIKFDGYRIMAHVADGKAKLISRNGKDWSAKLPEIAAALPALPVAKAILDGEVCDVLPNGVTSFSGLQEALSERKTGRLVYFLFDVLYLDGWRLDRCAQIDRKALLAELMADPPNQLAYSDHHAGQGPEFFDQAKKTPGVEGIVSKKADAAYTAGRNTRWLKVKATGREELIVLGYTDPEGSRIGFGGLVLGYHSRTRGGPLTFAGAVGTGFSNTVLKQLHGRLRAMEQPEPNVSLPKGSRHGRVHWVRPELVAEVAFTEWTRDGILRHPAFLGLREDKAADDVVLDREISETASVSLWGKMRRR